MANFLDLQKELGYEFNDTSLLRQALTHRSYSRNNNERLEFVGDGILDYVIALNLYHLYPDLPEGELSKMRAGLVNQDSLAQIAGQLNLGHYLFLGDGEVKSGGRKRPSILADALEAIFAAVSLDGDFEKTRKVIEKLFYSPIHKQQQEDITDYKTHLQEYVQALHYKLPVYEVVSMSGPEHDMLFKVECFVNELHLRAFGEGKGKKQASQHAAFNLLKLLKERELNGNE